MKKSVIKESLKVHSQAISENQTEISRLEVLNKPLPQPGIEMLPQSTILRNVNLYTKEKAIDLRLEESSGPYLASYTEGGAHLLLTSRSGYAAAFNTHTLDLAFETETGEQIYDSCFLHNELFFAAAHKSALFIYNNDGCEQHAVRDVSAPRLLRFLPYHFLLVSATANARLKYLDTSTGTVVSDLFVRDKSPTVLSSNSTNGVIHLGSTAGTVSLWAPSQPEYLMKIKAHTAAITGLAVDRSGDRMVTTGLDRKLRLFDMRQTFRPLKSTTLKVSSKVSTLSDRNLLAISSGSKVAVLKDFEQQPYLTHRVNGDVTALRFCPFEDLLTITHTKGISTIVVPGSGDPNYDSTEVTPFMTKKQRQELEVKRLKEKIPFDMIAQESVLSGVSKSVITRPKVSDRYFNGDRAEKKALSRFKKPECQ